MPAQADLHGILRNPSYPCTLPGLLVMVINHSIYFTVAYLSYFVQGWVDCTCQRNGITAPTPDRTVVDTCYWRDWSWVWSDCGSHLSSKYSYPYIPWSSCKFHGQRVSSSEYCLAARKGTWYQTRHLHWTPLDWTHICSFYLCNRPVIPLKRSQKYGN